jgi:hypothetical protein
MFLRFRNCELRSRAKYKAATWTYGIIFSTAEWKTIRSVFGTRLQHGLRRDSPAAEHIVGVENRLIVEVDVRKRIQPIEHQIDVFVRERGRVDLNVRSDIPSRPGRSIADGIRCRDRNGSAMSLLRSKSVCTTPGTCAGCHSLTSDLSVFATARNCHPESRFREEGSAASSGNTTSEPNSRHPKR